jgi:RNA polymerase sigma factor (sigma-70 family)
MSSAATGLAKELEPEEFFLQRYKQLLKWALRLTRSDRHLAEDLVQDAFLQFRVAQHGLTINNIDSYLHGIVRNNYISHLRRGLRRQQESLTDHEADLASALDLAFDPSQQLYVRDQLRAICDHACRRKDSSVAASILILRFFHGYFPKELATVLHTSRNVVDVQLRAARFEAIAYLEKRDLAIPARRPTQQRNSGPLRNDNLFAELRATVFASRDGYCLTGGELRAIYEARKPLHRDVLSHMVSCPTCLDLANEILGLKPLVERNAVDSLGRSDVKEHRMYEMARGALGLFLSTGIWLLLDGGAYTDILDAIS